MWPFSLARTLRHEEIARYNGACGCAVVLQTWREHRTFRALARAWQARPMSLRLRDYGNRIYYNDDYRWVGRCDQRHIAPPHNDSVCGTVLFYTLCKPSSRQSAQLISRPLNHLVPVAMTIAQTRYRLARSHHRVPLHHVSRDACEPPSTEAIGAAVHRNNCLMGISSLLIKLN